MKDSFLHHNIYLKWNNFVEYRLKPFNVLHSERLTISWKKDMSRLLDEILQLSAVVALNCTMKIIMQFFIGFFPLNCYEGTPFKVV
jgi:hypothetical protein